LTIFRSKLLSVPLVLTLSLVPAPILAIDGGGAAPPDPPPTGSSDGTSLGALTTQSDSLATQSDPLASDAPSYYQEAVEQGGSARAASLDAGAPAGLPSSLYVVPAKGSISYRDHGDGDWTVSVTMAERPHEKLDAVYDLVLALPLPLAAQAKTWRIPVRQGIPSRSVPAIYAGEKIALKRNTPLETTWLPVLLASSALPDLSDSGYGWTLWDTIVRYDASAGSTVQGFGSLDYTAGGAVAALDPDDPRSAAYVITWVPTLDAAVPPFTIRLDVVAPN